MSEVENAEARLELVRERTESLREVLKEGDEFLIRCYGKYLFVEPTTYFNFRQTSPRLWSYLSKLELQMKFGRSWFLTLLIGLIYMSITNHFDWSSDLLGERLAASLNSWWFKTFQFFVTLYLFEKVFALLARRTYWRGRPELLKLMAAEHLDRDTLLKLIAESVTLPAVYAELTLDSGPFETAQPLRTCETAS